MHVIPSIQSRTLLPDNHRFMPSHCGMLWRTADKLDIFLNRRILFLCFALLYLQGSYNSISVSIEIILCV